MQRRSRVYLLPAAFVIGLLLLSASAGFTQIVISKGCPYVVTSTIPERSNAASESSRYPDTNGKELTDGIVVKDSDGRGLSDPKWVGWLNQDWRVVTIDLKRLAQVYYVMVDCAQSDTAAVFFPRWVSVMVSEDGARWSPPARAGTPIPLTRTGWVRQQFRVNLPRPTDARYVQVAIPVDAWVFVDEVMVLGIGLTAPISGPGDPERIAAEKRGFLQPLPLAGWLRPGTEQTAGTRHIVLIYNHGDPAKDVRLDVNFFKTYVAHLNKDLQPDDTFFDSFLFLPRPSGPSSRRYDGAYTPSNVLDWEGYLNRIFESGYQLSALNQAVSSIRSTLEKPEKVKVIIAIPYPAPSQTDFGDPWNLGRSLNFTREEDRYAAVQWYMEQVLISWSQLAFRNLELVGFYWFEEKAAPGDENLLHRVSTSVHNRGYRFFWIPWFHANGFKHWRSHGFDCAMMQPNYAFSSALPVDNPGSRLVPAALLSAKYRLGMEIEIGYDLSDPSVQSKYLAYLDYGRKMGYMTGSVCSYYQSIDAFYAASRSTDPDIRRLYDETWRFVKGMW